MEAHLSAMALWYRVAGLMMGVASLALLAFSGGRHPLNPGGVHPTILASFLDLTAAISFATGCFLARFSDTAHILAMLFAWLFLAFRIISIGMIGITSTIPGVGFQTWMLRESMFSLIATLGIAPAGWALLSSRSDRICSRDYQEMIAEAPQTRPDLYRSPVFWGPILFLGVQTIHLIRYGEVC